MYCNQVYGDDEFKKKGLYCTETELDKILLKSCLINVGLFIFSEMEH